MYDAKTIGAIGRVLLHGGPSRKRRRARSRKIGTKSSRLKAHDASVEAKALNGPVPDSMTILAIPIDLTEHVIGLLDLQSVVALVSTNRSAALSKQWIHTLWKRACSTRWRYKPIDQGSGKGLALDLSRPDWLRASLAREWIEMRIMANDSAADMIRAIVQLIAKRMSNDNIFEEGVRWIVEIFDQSEEQNLSHADAEEGSLRCLLAVSSRLMGNSHCQQLAVKAFGTLAMSEHNRQILPKLGVVELVRKAMQQHQFNSDLVENALWALVILGRPLGCREGSRFMIDRVRSVCHISDHMTNEVVLAVVSTAKRHITHPSVLTKAFWSMVNLALIDINKQVLVSHRAVHLIIMAMNKYPNEKLLHFRACFALINLSLNRDARNLIRTLNGIEAILASMRRFPEFAMLQRCGCNILMSMAWASSANRQRMVKMRASDIVEQAMERHSSHSDLSQIASSLLMML